VSTSPSERTRWFATEVQPHEPALRAYLHARFPNLEDHDDVVQEAYSRLLRASERGGVRFIKAFLFTTARNAAFDLFRRRKIIGWEAITDFRELSVLEERPNAAEAASQQQELEILSEALRTLPERCRRIVTLRYRDGLSNKEIATQLGLSPETVKSHMVKGVRRCAEYFQERGIVPAANSITAK
jgi:RNA polymerase sigma factor (sigma-70 family)